ncbi:MAG: DinB family protein [Gemmatimonadaceae bacterium]|nr:DinB family protein [Gemmatimonadaceae bacterium]MCW5826843.1 DinB family protein [Gemmatimonadaceae bacterium]
MSNHIQEVCHELTEVTHAARVAFGPLSAEQLNWKPSAESWSIAQCLDHLITINRFYFPLLESMSTDTPGPTFWERHSPLSGFLGKFLIKTLGPEYPKRTKTSPKAEPSASAIDARILDTFARHQGELIEHLRRIPSSIDLKGTIVTSPLLGWVTYRLEDCLTMLAVHEKRHLLQARRVMEAAGFPKAV